MYTELNDTWQTQYPGGFYSDVFNHKDTSITELDEAVLEGRFTFEPVQQMQLKIDGKSFGRAVD